MPLGPNEIAHLHICLLAIVNIYQLPVQIISCFSIVETGYFMWGRLGTQIRQKCPLTTSLP